MANVTLQYAGFTDIDNLPIYTMVSVQAANITSGKIVLDTNGETSTVDVYNAAGQVTDRLPVSEDCIYVVTRVVDGTRVAEVVDFATLKTLASDFESTISGAYVFDEAWTYTAGSGEREVITEIYVNLDNRP